MNLAAGIALTMHLHSAGEPNEVHPFIELEHEGYSIGAYLNSIDETSFYATYTFEHDDWFLEVGGVTGYKRADVLPYGRVGYNITNTASVFVAPTIHADGSNLGAVIGVQFRFTP
jgi:hypothetical protein